MNSAKVIFTKIHSNLNGLGYNSYIYIAPANSTYPFVTYYVSNMSIEYTFTGIIDYVDISLNIFDNTEDVSRLLDMSEAIDTSLSNITTSSIICSKIDNGVGPTYNTNEHYWSINKTYRFITGRNQ